MDERARVSCLGGIKKLGEEEVVFMVAATVRKIAGVFKSWRVSVAVGKIWRV